VLYQKRIHRIETYDDKRRTSVFLQTVECSNQRLEFKNNDNTTNEHRTCLYDYVRCPVKKVIVERSLN
jgi:hypothetical protein